MNPVEKTVPNAYQKMCWRKSGLKAKTVNKVAVAINSNNKIVTLTVIDVVRLNCHAPVSSVLF